MAELRTITVRGGGGAVFDIDVTPAVEQLIAKGELVELEPPTPEPKPKAARKSVAKDA